MNLYRMLQQRVAAGNPVRVGLIGAGKFGSMYLSQIPRTPGIHLLGVADLDPVRASVERATADMRNAGGMSEGAEIVNLKRRKSA